MAGPLLHAAIGMAAGRAYAETESRPPSLALAMAAFAALSILPDTDLTAFLLGIPYRAPFGHRGAIHSLAVAAAVGVLGALLARLARRKPIKAGLFAAGIVASHDLLDTLTTGGLGIALLWPFTNRRFFAPWHLIPVSPIGFGFFSYRGLHVVAAEFLISLPFLLYAFWKRKPAANERL